MKHSNKSNIDILKDYVAGVRPFVQVGYVGESKKHRIEGERWVDSENIEWEHKNGRNVRITKTQGDIIREAIGEGMNCKKCGLNYKWAGKHDVKFLHRTGLCSDCLIDYETQLRILGIYDDYEKYKLVTYKLGMMKDARDKIKDTIKFFSESSGDVEMICNSEGFIERWKDLDPTNILKTAKSDLKIANKQITSTTKEKNLLKKKYLDSAKKYNLKSYV